MQFSAELRWFHAGPLPEKVLEAFSQGHEPKVEKPRTDRYLGFPGCETVGVKVRAYDEKRHVEIKALQGSAETIQLPGSVSGRVEYWVKWSYGEEPVAPLVSALLAGSGEEHRDVLKKRYLRKFSLDGGGPVEVSPDERPAEGCVVELTDLEITEPSTGPGPQKWWTLALEAFGKRENVRTNLLAAANVLFREVALPEQFHTSNSCSYATWLEGIPPTSE